MTIWRTRIACWIPKATNTHSQYTILIAIAVQQLLQKRALNVTLYVNISFVPYSSQKVSHVKIFTVSP